MKAGKYLPRGLGGSGKNVVDVGKKVDAKLNGLCLCCLWVFRLNDICAACCSGRIDHGIFTESDSIGTHGDHGILWAGEPEQLWGQPVAHCLRYDFIMSWLNRTAGIFRRIDDCYGNAGRQWNCSSRGYGDGVKEVDSCGSCFQVCTQNPVCASRCHHNRDCCFWTDWPVQ